MNRVMEDLLPEKKAREIEDDECLVCKCHQIAEEQIPNVIVCPCCGDEVQQSKVRDFEVVGQANYYDPKHKIGKYQTHQCYKCDEMISLIPTKIMYNGNHDIYYTGGNKYLEDDENKIFLEAQKKIEADLKQWARRILAGEDPKSMCAGLWLKRDVTEAIAEYLYEKGFKK